jgi:hypothetical protein
MLPRRLQWARHQFDAFLSNTKPHRVADRRFAAQAPRVGRARSLVVIVMVMPMIIIMWVVSVMMPIIIINRSEITGIGRNLRRKRRDGRGLRNSGNGCGNGNCNNEDDGSIRHGVSFLRLVTCC